MTPRTPPPSNARIRFGPAEVRRASSERVVVTFLRRLRVIFPLLPPRGARTLGPGGDGSARHRRLGTGGFFTAALERRLSGRFRTPATSWHWDFLDRLFRLDRTVSIVNETSIPGASENCEFRQGS